MRGLTSPPSPLWKDLAFKVVSKAPCLGRSFFFSQAALKPQKYRKFLLSVFNCPMQTTPSPSPWGSRGNSPCIAARERRRCQSPMQLAFVARQPSQDTRGCCAFLNFSFYIPGTIYRAEKQSDHQNIGENVSSKVRNALFQKELLVLLNSCIIYG